MRVLEPQPIFALQVRRLMVVGGFWAVKAGRQSVEMAHVEW